MSLLQSNIFLPSQNLILYIQCIVYTVQERGTTHCQHCQKIFQSVNYMYHPVYKFTFVWVRLPIVNTSGKNEVQGPVIKSINYGLLCFVHTYRQVSNCLDKFPCSSVFEKINVRMVNKLPPYESYPSNQAHCLQQKAPHVHCTVSLCLWGQKTDLVCPVLSICVVRCPRSQQIR